MAPSDAAAVDVVRRPSTPGASAISALSSVVLPCPFRPTSTIFSPRFTIPLKPLITARSPKLLVTSENSMANRPDGRAIVNLM